VVETRPDGCSFRGREVAEREDDPLAASKDHEADRGMDLEVGLGLSTEARFTFRGGGVDTLREHGEHLRQAVAVSAQALSLALLARGEVEERPAAAHQEEQRGGQRGSPVR